MAIVGRQSPEVSLEGYFNGKFDTYKLSSYRGKWVYLLFYPLDFTFVCPTEVLSFSDHAPEFAERGCQLFGVSVDSKFVHKAWVETAKKDGGLGGSLRYPLLSDTKREVAAAFGVLEEQGEVCPADWDEGKETMKATPEGMHAYLSQR